MLDATLEGFQFLVTFFVHFNEISVGNAELPAIVAHTERREKKNKWSLYKIAVCLYLVSKEIIERWATTFSNPTVPPFLPWLRGPETLSTLPTKPTNQSDKL